MFIPSFVGAQKFVFFSRGFYHGLAWAQPKVKEVLCLPRRLEQVQLSQPRTALFEALQLHQWAQKRQLHPWARRGRSCREVGALPM